jgi:hypothetical protein
VRRGAMLFDKRAHGRLVTRGFNFAEGHIRRLTLELSGCRRVPHDSSATEPRQSA